MRPLLSFILESQMGTEVTDDMIDMLVTPDMLAQIEGQFAAESQDLSTDAMEVVLEADGVGVGVPGVTGADR